MNVKFHIFKIFRRHLKSKSSASNTSLLVLYHLECLCMCVCALRHVQLFATPRTIAHQAPLSMGFSRQDYWRGFPFHSPGDLPDPGIKPVSPTNLHWQADILSLSPWGSLHLEADVFITPCYSSVVLRPVASSAPGSWLESKF